MKLFLKVIALAAKDPNFKGHPRQELNRLIDVAESSGVVVWHDDFCFKSSFWDWGNRETGNINWGGYGSSYKPANERYFKFQYPKDMVDANGKLIIRKGAKPLDAVKALILPGADADGTMQALLAKAGANPVFVADKELKADAIVDLLTKKKCNFLLTADTLPPGLTEALDKAAKAKNYFFTLPVGRLRPLLEKPKRAPVACGPKPPPAFADKDDAKAYTKLKQLLSSKKFEEIDQAITLLPGLPGVCDKLLEGISFSAVTSGPAPEDPGTWQNWVEKHGDAPEERVKYLSAFKSYRSSTDRTKAITAWTNDGKAWSANYDRPSSWGSSEGSLPCDLTVLGENIRLAEIPKNDLFNSSEVKRYALFSVINAAPEDCAPAKAIREGLVALHWRNDRLPPLSNFTGLRHLYLENTPGTGFSVGLVSLVYQWGGGVNSAYKLSLDWIHPIKSLRKIQLDLNEYSSEMSEEFMKKAAFPALEELFFDRYGDGSPALPAGIKTVGIKNLWISHERLPEMLAIPHLRAGDVRISKAEYDDRLAPPEEPRLHPVKIVPVKDRGEVLPARELAALKKLLRDDSPETVMQGLKILRTASPATLDSLLDKSTIQWNSHHDGVFSQYSRLEGPFFDSLKRNDLGQAVRINLLSLASPGCKPADEIRMELRELTLPKALVPIDVSGFVGILKLKITLDPSKQTENWITGLEKLSCLKRLELELTEGGWDKKLVKPYPLGFTPPESVTEMEIELGYKEVRVKPDFITVSPNLRKLTLKGLGPLENITYLRGIDPAKLEELRFENSYSDNKVPSKDLSGLASFVNLVSITGSLNHLKTLKGITALQKLSRLELDNESLEDISEATKVPSLESLTLGDYCGQEVAIGGLAFLPSLLSLDLGKHKVADIPSLLKFRPGTKIKLQGLVSEKK